MLKAKLNDRSPGFTLIELLVVVAIIGLLLSIISISLTASRTRARDTRRISDMKQYKTGLDLYYAQGSGYPDTINFLTQAGQTLQCSGTTFFRIADDPAAPVYHYTYTSSGSSSSGCGGIVRSAYGIQFFIENKGAYYTMDEDGTVRDSANNPVSFDSLL